jgi:hypothetical protein
MLENTERASKNDNPEKLATQGAQDEEKQNKIQWIQIYYIHISMQAYSESFSSTLIRLSISTLLGNIMAIE